DRDLAVVVPEQTDASIVVGIVREQGGGMLDRVSIFDVYRGDQIGDDEKSLALRLRFRAGDRTLSDEEVEPVWEKIVTGLQAVGGRLRA
ncbi:MAG: hypothetical protein KDB62_03045, partial [Solirubrobacterales bacterium]|nr:hypothetical protein [Solirubrobacterales bacterium]